MGMFCGPDVCDASGCFPWNVVAWTRYHPWWSLFIFIYFGIFLYEFQRRAICTCGEHFIPIGVIEALFWPATIIIDAIR